VSRKDELKRRLEQGRQRRRRLSWALLALLLLLLLLCSRCTCAPPVEAPEAPLPPAQVEPPEAAPAPAPLPDRPSIPRIDRPAFETEPQDPLPWLDEFRLQVAARSPRLAGCFVGAERPGRLRWTASVEPSRGRISQQAVEPVLVMDALTSEQKGCVVGVLADPPYELRAEEGASTPTRVSLVVEF
jgi:hypothetical protein